MNKISFKSVNKTFPSCLSFSDLLQLNFKKKQETAAIKDISFTIDKSSLIGILGENGAGKTTLLKLLSGLLTPDSGKILISGLNPAEKPLDIKRKTGITLNQQRSFYWRLTARENINFFASMHNLNKKTIQKRIERLFNVLSIDKTIYEKRFDNLSSGMMKKFSIIRALIHNPDIVLLDEPTKNLDYASSLRFNAFARDYLVKEQGKIVFYVSHDISELESLSDKIIILNKGKLLSFSTINDLRENQGNSLSDIFIKMVNRDE